MSGDFLADRRRGAEEAFFAKQNEQLRVQLRESAAHPTKQTLSDASGITDDAVLDTLIHQGVGGEGAAALSLIPLVAVAWADGDCSVKERAALLSAAEGAGLDRKAAGYKLFEGWLHEEPPASLLDRWRDYVGAVSAGMDPGARTAFGNEILGRAQAVAEAAGGFLGLGRVSAAEEAVLTDLKRTLQA